MRKFAHLFSAACLALVSGASANSQDFFLFGHDDTPCISLVEGAYTFCYSKEGKHKMPDGPASVRIRVIDPVVDESVPFKIALSRPFFIIDGIHLSTDEARTLDQLEEETQAFGIPEILTNLGYTPILVQFAQTVRVGLESNAKTFSALLQFLSDNSLVSFPNRQEDGFIVLGISQGGIIGRYGAYLYDTHRKATDAPVRIYASLDSPHQGAVMPRGLISTIDFWANKAGVASAEAFYDLISSPGARDLLLYDTQAGNNTYEVKTGKERFLFGEYRKAADYKGFPAVLLSQGQMKGKSPEHSKKYYSLNRSATRNGEAWGRAVSEMAATDKDSEEFSYNRVYEFLSQNETSAPKGTASHDFIQGSTYPFAKTMYKSLREGMEEAIPDDLSFTIEPFGLPVYTIDFTNTWNQDTLYQASSTFIPTASAIDLQCDGDLAIRSDCAFSVSQAGFPFEKPGKRSTAKAVYAVDETHPRYNEAISGRHIESPVNKDGSIDSTVLKGMQTEIWRLLCEVAKVDYDSANREFRNAKLTGLFSPTTSCMDASAMPEIIANGGTVRSKNFGYIRYDYNSDATEAIREVSFALPSGWQRVALVDNAKDVPEGAIFETEIKVESPKSNWMKAELLLTQGRNGGGQVQLDEQKVTQDGQFHAIRWQMPTAKGAMAKYRWFRLVLNSNGGKVTLRNTRLLTTSRTFSEKPADIGSATLFPSSYRTVNWNASTAIKQVKVGNDDATEFSFKELYAGAHLDLGGTFSFDKYKELNVEYLASTCRNSEIYFGTASRGRVNLDNNSRQNEFVNKVLPLVDIINTDVTAGNGLSASRLSLQALMPNETCTIRSIRLQ